MNGLNSHLSSKARSREAMVNWSFFLLLNHIHLMEAHNSWLVCLLNIFLLQTCALVFPHPVVHTFIIAHLNYCNSLLSGLWMSAGYPVVFTKHQLEHATLLIKELPGFPSHRIKSKPLASYAQGSAQPASRLPFSLASWYSQIYYFQMHHPICLLHALHSAWKVLPHLLFFASVFSYFKI